MLAAVAASRSQGVAVEQLAASLAAFRSAEHNPGRGNLFRVASGGYVMLDYGHNADAFAAICRMAEQWKGRRVTGDRDDALIEDYDAPSSPVQLAVSRVVEQFSDTPLRDIAVGFDGCGVPAFGVSVRAMALMAARLVAPPAGWDEGRREACRRVVSAMRTHPEMVEGTGEMDTEIMLRTGGRLVSKVGAEGVYTAAVLPCAEWPRGLGVALKLEDGDRKERARPVAVIETLRQLGILRAEELHALSRFARAAARNHRGDHVGEVGAAFELKRVAN